MKETTKKELDELSLQEIYEYMNNRCGVKVGKVTEAKLRILSKLEAALNEKD